ncbi:MAG: protein-methionine-sulfoxide reductase heme-binding subunit MsrQ, partial [Marinobacter sp.]
MAAITRQTMIGVVAKPLVFIAALVPLAVLVKEVVSGGIGPDPGQAITERLGLTAFQLLLLTLSITPLKKLTGWNGWLRYRRMLGLFVLFYASLHILAFLQLLLGWRDLWATFTERPYIIAGASAFLLMLPLAVTSTKAMMKRVGRGWKPLHRLIYLAAVLVWVHFLWQARSDITEMVVYGGILLILLGLRAY